jgi:hypothetical protein
MDKLWVIIGQRQTTIMVDGQLQSVVEVRYKIPSINFTGLINVPADQFSTEAVAAAVEKAAATHVEVHHL